MISGDSGFPRNQANKVIIANSGATQITFNN